MSGSKPSSSTGAAKPRAPRTTKTTKAAKAAAATEATVKAARTRTPKAAALAAPPTATQHRRQQRIGKVVSDKMQKTIVVAVESLKRHPLYKRTYRSTNRFKAHDENNDARMGDLVRIEETRPLSKEKRWRLVEILNRAVQAPSVESVVAELSPTVEG